MRNGEQREFRPQEGRELSGAQLMEETEAKVLKNILEEFGENKEKEVSFIMGGIAVRIDAINLFPSECIDALVEEISLIFVIVQNSGFFDKGKLPSEVSYDIEDMRRSISTWLNTIKIEQRFKNIDQSNFSSLEEALQASQERAIKYSAQGAEKIINMFCDGVRTRTKTKTTNLLPAQIDYLYSDIMRSVERYSNQPQSFDREKEIQNQIRAVATWLNTCTAGAEKATQTGSTQPSKKFTN